MGRMDYVDNRDEQADLRDLEIDRLEHEHGLELMRHALGWPKNYRNYFAASPGGHDALAWERLVKRGHAERGKVINQPPHELQIYHVTDAGRAALNPKP